MVVQNEMTLPDDLGREQFDLTVLERTSGKYMHDAAFCFTLNCHSKC